MIEIPVHRLWAERAHCLSCDDVIKPYSSAHARRHLACEECNTHGWHEDKVGVERRMIREAIEAVLGEYD